MGKVTWSSTAITDADAAAQYIAQDSEDQASLFILRLYEATDMLSEFPLLGRVIPELRQEDEREIIVGAYRVMYQVSDSDRVIITRVLHGARDWRP